MFVLKSEGYIYKEGGPLAGRLIGNKVYDGSGAKQLGYFIGNELYKAKSTEKMGYVDGEKVHFLLGGRWQEVSLYQFDKNHFRGADSDAKAGLIYAILKRAEAAADGEEEREEEEGEEQDGMAKAA